MDTSELQLDRLSLVVHVAAAAAAAAAAVGAGIVGAVIGGEVEEITVALGRIRPVLENVVQRLLGRHLDVDVVLPRRRCAKQRLRRRRAQQRRGRRRGSGVCVACEVEEALLEAADSSDAPVEAGPGGGVAAALRPAVHAALAAAATAATAATTTAAAAAVAAALAAIVLAAAVLAAAILAATVAIAAAGADAAAIAAAVLLVLPLVLVLLVLLVMLVLVPLLLLLFVLLLRLAAAHFVVVENGVNALLSDGGPLDELLPERRARLRRGAGVRHPGHDGCGANRSHQGQLLQPVKRGVVHVVLDPLPLGSGHTHQDQG